MLKTVLSMAALAAALPGAASAATGAWASFVGIDTDASGPAALSWYDGPQFAVKELNDFAGANLGSFAQGSSAWLAGGDLFTFKNNGGNVTGATMFWRVDSGSYNAVQLAWNSNAPLTYPGTSIAAGGGNDQSWRVLGNSANFLQGLGVGSHQLQVYFQGFSNQGDFFASTAANPMSAGFAVTAPVPEPGSWALMLGGLGALGLLSRRRFKRS